MRVFTSLLPLSLASGALGAAISPRNNRGACNDLWEKAPQLLPDLEVYYAAEYEAGTTFNATGEAFSIAYPAAVPDLPAFCRFGGWIHTAGDNRVQFEVWLPSPDVWSGRFAHVGNGGDTGGVNFPDMAVPLTKYHLAVASTDTGHHGTSGDGTFAAGNPESQINFGHRAVHLSTVYSKAIVEAYYGKPQDYSYWLGCSSGGKQGLKEVQAYPEDYDGVIAGAAAQYWERLNAQTYRINAIVNAIGSPGYLNASDYAVIGANTLAQCDELDGVKDNIILDPSKCKPDLTPIICGNPGSNSSACITEAQAQTMRTIWADYHYLNGTWLFAGFNPGAEVLSTTFSVNGVPYGPGPDFYRFQVLNVTDTSYVFNETDPVEFEKLVDTALATNPGQTNAGDPNIEPFLKRGKLITFVGLADTLIPTGSTHHYWEEVQKALGYKDLTDSYRLFDIPGMGHCQSGQAGYNFGGPQQRQVSLGGRGQGKEFTPQRDMILALIDWVENGNAPDTLIGAKYVGDDIRNGSAYERKFCVYPKQAVYIGGDTNSADSFECRYV
ncbi:hypothetical protein JCM8547_002379 [Rhodosporidiobolus lusitaniae]